MYLLSVKIFLFPLLQLQINASEYFQNNIRNLYFELKRNAELLRKSPEPYV